MRYGVIRSLIFFLCFALPVLLDAQMVVKGKVFCKGKKVKGAAVSANSTAKLFSPVRTNRSGSFEIETSGKGDYLLVSKKGYVTQSVAIGDKAQIVVILEKKSPKKIHLFKRERRRSGCPPENPLCRCCFYRGTKILLQDGSEKNIERIQPGDLIYNTDLNNFTVAADSVLFIDSVFHNNLIEIEFENKLSIISTSDHPYYVQGKGWSSFEAQLTRANYGIKASDLKVGDLCLRLSEGKLKPLAIRAIKQLGKGGMTYNISGLQCRSNYFANGILVSNEMELLRLTEK